MYCYILLPLLVGCLNLNKGFVEKYENENFSSFKNRSFLIRNISRDGNMEIFVSVNIINASKNGPYVVTVNKESGRIVETSTHLMSDTSELVKEEIHNLIPIFLKYKIYSLLVDSNDNVFIRLREIDNPDLIRFSDKKYKTKEYNGWKNIKGNWYELP